MVGLCDQCCLNRKELVRCQLIFPSWQKHITNAHQEETQTAIAHQKEINTAAQKEPITIAHQEKINTAIAYQGETQTVQETNTIVPYCKRGRNPGCAEEKGMQDDVFTANCFDRCTVSS